MSTRHDANNHFKNNIDKTHRNLYYGSVIESLLIVVLSVLQLFYMKKLLESKQLI